MTSVTPISVRHDAVREEWIDYNQHLSEAYYVLVFGFATDDVMDQIGLDETYRAATGSSLFTVEAHVRYLDQVSLGETMEIRSFVIGSGAKKVRLWHELWADGRLRATEELLMLSVDTDAGRSAPMADDVADRLRAATVPVPETAGGAISS